MGVFECVRVFLLREGVVGTAGLEHLLCTSEVASPLYPAT
jgi:hypothetical protein